jgi:hypothetical protein
MNGVVKTRIVELEMIYMPVAFNYFLKNVLLSFLNYRKVIIGEF